MAQVASKAEVYGPAQAGQPTLSGDTRRRLGSALRTVYEQTVDTQPIPDPQIDLLLRLRHRERELKRA